MRSRRIFPVTVNRYAEDSSTTLLTAAPLRMTNMEKCDIILWNSKAHTKTNYVPKERIFDMIYISPSLLAADYTKLGEEVKRVEDAGANYLHLDVMDGIFVPNISFGVPVIKSIKKLTKIFNKQFVKDLAYCIRTDKPMIVSANVFNEFNNKYYTFAIDKNFYMCYY